MKEIIKNMGPTTKKIILTIILLVISIITTKLAITSTRDGWVFLWFLWALVSGAAGGVSSVVLILGFWAKWDKE